MLNPSPHILHPIPHAPTSSRQRIWAARHPRHLSRRALAAALHRAARLRRVVQRDQLGCGEAGGAAGQGRPRLPAGPSDLQPGAAGGGCRVAGWLRGLVAEGLGGWRQPRKAWLQVQRSTPLPRDPAARLARPLPPFPFAGRRRPSRAVPHPPAAPDLRRRPVEGRQRPAHFRAAGRGLDAVGRGRRGGGGPAGVRPAAWRRRLAHALHGPRGAREVLGVGGLALRAWPGCRTGLSSATAALKPRSLTHTRFPAPRCSSASTSCPSAAPSCAPARRAPAGGGACTSPRAERGEPRDFLAPEGARRLPGLLTNTHGP
jgi:hypothetical protein